VFGIGAALIGARLLASLLFGVSAADPATLAGVPLLLAVIAMGACLVPALRASRIDPLVALRED